MKAERCVGSETEGGNTGDAGVHDMPRPWRRPCGHPDETEPTEREEGGGDVPEDGGSPLDPHGRS